MNPQFNRCKPMKPSQKLRRVVAIIKTFDEVYTMKDVRDIYIEKHGGNKFLNITSCITKLIRLGKIDSNGRGIYTTNKFGKNYII